MSGCFAITVTQGAMSNLIYLATNAVSLGLGSETDMRNITRRVTRIQAMLHDAQNRMRESKSVRDWVRRIQFGINYLEDMLVEVSYEALRMTVEPQNHMTNKVRCCCCCFSSSNRLSSPFKRINLYLDELRRQGHDDLLIEAVMATDNDIIETSEFRPTMPPLDDSNVVGRREEVNAMVEMLLGNDIQDGPSVIAIVGMSGLGKTTLAQLVYKHDKVVNNFGNERMWVSGFADFNVERILNEMVKSLTGVESEAPNFQGIVRKLREKLSGKRYLLVLDDVWSRSIGKWECMRNSLLELGGSKGSKVIVTTPSMDVVSTMIKFSTDLTHQLCHLSPSDSWAVFRKRIFADGAPMETPPLADMHEIVEKCKGVPFTIKSMASLLWSRPNKREWESIKGNAMWSSLENGWASIKHYRIRSSFVNECGILKNLTFNQLPWCLKLCFAYCSVFSKGADMKKDELIRLWMAQGYLQPLGGPNLEMEDVGHDYFDILLRFSLFQDVEMDEYNNIETCKMHDHLYDFAVHVSKGYSFVGESIKYRPDLQHLSLELWDDSTIDVLRYNDRTLRTLFLTGCLPKNFEESFRIRALGLFGDDVQKLPSPIQKFIYLKYLDLSETSIGKLPNFVTKLYNLETLKLPRSLTELPTELHKLVSLRHLCITDTLETRKLMPTNIGLLTSLQTIPFFVVKEGSGHGIEELGRLSKLRGKLHVYDLQHVKDKKEAEKSFMSQKANIQELGFHWGGYDDDSNNHEDVLEGLQPHRNVMGLILECFPGRRFPSWMMSRDARVLQNLVKVELRCCARCEQIPSLGHLSALKVIEIVGLHNLECIGPEFFGHDDEGAPEALVFPKLRKLTLDDLPKLVEWSLSASTSTTVFFPCLEELYIKGCPQLITIPSHLFSFQELTISSINLSSARIGNVYHPSLTISSADLQSERIGDLLTDVLENSSESVRKLTVRGLNELSCLPKKLRNLPSLEELAIIECSDLMSIANKSEGFNGLTSLRRLSIRRCEKLTFLPKGLLQRTLVTLEIDSCPKLIMANPYELRSLVSLQSLTIRNCPTKLGSLERSWKKGLLCPSSILRLEIGSFSEDLDYFPWPSASAFVPAAHAEVDLDIERCHHCYRPTMYSFITLRSLHLWGWEKIKHLPDELQHVTTLRELSIHNFNGLEALPEWLVNLSSLQSLGLHSCRNLMRFPIDRLTSVQILTVKDCPLLRKRCKKGVGAEWRKINHIPFINITFAAQEYS